MKKKNDKIGILGGTFDPPHLGHLHISRLSLKKLKLQKVIWIVTKQNPFKKKSLFNKDMRIKLSKKLVKNENRIFVKYLDNITKSKNTFDLLKYLKKKNKKNKLFFIMGADNLINFHKWKNWKKIPEMAKIVVFARSGYSIKALRSVAARKLKRYDWHYIPGKKINISSSIIRKF